MTLRGGLIAAWAAALVCGLVGCGGSPKPASPRGAGLMVDVTIANGQVTPTNATLQAKVQQPITLHVTSDAADELHVHSTPDHKFQVAAAPTRRSSSPSTCPGNVDVELHHLDRTVATIQVRSDRAAAVVLAHGLGGSSDLPVPYAYALIGAAWALTFTFALVAFAWRRPRFDPAQAGPAPAAAVTTLVDSPA